MSAPNASGAPLRSPVRPLAIALVNNLYPPYIVGGNEILARDVAEGLRRRGHTVHILTGRGRDLPQDAHTHPALDIDLDRKGDVFLGGLPLTAMRVMRWHLYNGRTYRSVRETLARLQPDLIICWNLYMASASPLLAARRLHAPVIAHPADKWLLYMLDDLGMLIPANTWAQNVFVGAIRSLVQPLLKWRARPDYILAVSEFIRRLHSERATPRRRARQPGWGSTWTVFLPRRIPIPKGDRGGLCLRGSFGPARGRR